MVKDNENLQIYEMLKKQTEPLDRFYFIYRLKR